MTEARFTGVTNKTRVLDFGSGECCGVILPSGLFFYKMNYMKDDVPFIMWLCPSLRADLCLLKRIGGMSVAG